MHAHPHHPRAHIPASRLHHAVQIPEAAVNTRVARFSFADLCSRPVGAGDYLAIAKRFHTVFLVGVPVLDTGVRINETRRFITLVDQL